MSNDSFKNHYNCFLEHCSDFVISLDLKFKIITVSSTAERILNISKSKAVGQNLFAVCEHNQIKLSFTEEDLTRYKETKNKFIDGYVFLCAQKKKIFMLWKYVFVSNRQKNKSYFLIFGKDVSALESIKETDLLATIHLKNILENLPEYIYWKDLSFTYRGCNKQVSDYLNLSSPEDIVGKTDRDFGWSEERVQILYNIDKKIIETGVSNIVEDIIPKPDNSERVMLSSKTPLRDASNNIIGIVGISVDITDRKKTEKLQLEKDRLDIENTEHKKVIQEQEKFKIIANQVAHDIRSPLASLSMIVESCKNIPESDRIALKDVSICINDIANNLLSKYKKYDSEIRIDTKAQQPILVSLTLAEVLSEKKYQYKGLQIKFNCFFEQSSNFVFVKADPSNFHRMLSNLINNAVEAFDGKKGNVDLKINTDGEYVNIIVQDNGKGIPKEVLDKIKNNISVTSGKRDGSGIGLDQVRSTLLSSKGKISIESEIGKGTKVKLTFPKVKSPDWIAEQIKLYKECTVVVLDDDLSIHGAWEARFKHYPGIQLQHFKLGEDAINFINHLKAKEKEGLFLLSDFELIDQKLNGLQIIEKLAMQPQSILVTSHCNNQEICDCAAASGVKVLPKQLVANVSIKIVKKEKEQKADKKAATYHKKVDLVIIDDDQVFADSLANFFKDKFVAVEAYYDPNCFLKKLSQYAKDTKICMDNDFHSQISGIELAKRLNEVGYTRLYMLSGKSFEKEVIPNYLTVLLKGDIESLNELI